MTAHAHMEVQCPMAGEEEAFVAAISDNAYLLFRGDGGLQRLFDLISVRYQALAEHLQVNQVCLHRVFLLMQARYTQVVAQAEAERHVDPYMLFLYLCDPDGYPFVGKHLSAGCEACASVLATISTWLPPVEDAQKFVE